MFRDLLDGRSDCGRFLALEGVRSPVGGTCPGSRRYLSFQQSRRG
ncbi:hypothetical protein I544_2499 [Mycobacteroides abscessus subsp. bolletii 103]|nr:hypothetical protein MA6G0728S_4764 [Mycobacteroides abscessus 6G-0728-S]EUA81200.1 hypothetical protein I544_2499 [Mycobacteroides abscessus subsp. bolletii 103]